MKISEPLDFIVSDQPSTNAQCEDQKLITQNQKLIVDNHTINALELPLLLSKIASLAMSPLAAELINNLVPTVNLTLIKHRQRRLSQLIMLLLERDYPCNLERLGNVQTLLIRLSLDGAYLQSQELLEIANFLDLISDSMEFLKNSKARFDELYQLYSSLKPLSDVALTLKQIIGPGNSIVNTASMKLFHIRRELRAIREQLRVQLTTLFHRNDLAGIFNDYIITQRNDRYVVVIRANAKKQLNGIIHDTSSSGASYIIEPLEVIEANNQLALLQQKEKDEEKRILIVTSRLLASHLQLLHKNLSALVKLDCLLAQAKFCQLLDCIEPILNSEGQLDLLAVRHPLLSWQAITKSENKIKPINICLNQNKQILVISGVNAGGKTATLKTIGLVSLMAMCGLLLPCAEGSRIPIFCNVFAEIGDDQSLHSALSAFTAHASRLAWIINKIKKQSLVLIDEIGGNTDPSEGAALAAAVLDWLKKQGALVACTTHFNRLKIYAALTEGIENVSVAFDYKNNQPTYQLIYGLPGFSEALTISHSLGFPHDLLEAAQCQVDQGEIQILTFLHQIYQELDEIKTIRAEATADRLSAATMHEQARILLKTARFEQMKFLIDEGKRKIRNITACLEKRLEELFKNTYTNYELTQKNCIEINPLSIPRLGQIRQNIYTERRQALKEIEMLDKPSLLSLKNNSSSLTELYTCKIGDIVQLTNLDQHGTLLEVPRPGLKAIPVAVGRSGIRVMMPLCQIKPLAKEQKINYPFSSISIQSYINKDFSINIMGMTINEALPKLDKALDQAILAGKLELTVIHGIGTGRLRTAVRKFLNNHPIVISICQSENQWNATGVTVVKLKE